MRQPYLATPASGTLQENYSYMSTWSSSPLRWASLLFSHLYSRPLIGCVMQLRAGTIRNNAMQLMQSSNANAFFWRSWYSSRPCLRMLIKYGNMKIVYVICYMSATSPKLGTGGSRHWSATIIRQYGKPLMFWVMTQQKRRQRSFATPADEWSRGVSVAT